MTTYISSSKKDGLTDKLSCITVLNFLKQEMEIERIGRSKGNHETFKIFN